MKRPRLQPLLFGQELCRRELARDEARPFNIGVA